MRSQVGVWVSIVIVLAMPLGAAAIDTLPTGGGQSHENRQPGLGINHIIALQGIFPSRNLTVEDGLSVTGLGVSDPLLGEVSLFASNFAPRGWALCDGQLLPISQNQSLFALLGTTYGGDGRTTFALPDLRGRAVIGEGSGPGLTGRPLGSRVGQEGVTLSEAQMPNHAHGLPDRPDPTFSTGGGQSHTNMQPSLAMTRIISVQGIYPSRSLMADELGVSLMDSDPYIAEVGIFAGNFAPRGWASCDGQLLPISENTALFSLIGTTYGGDGRTTMGLPDLRGRTAVHEGNGPGLTPRNLGSRFGVEDVTLTTNQMPSHTHDYLLNGPQTTDPTGGGQPHENVQPSLALNYIIAMQGIYPSRSLTLDEPGLELTAGMEPFLGEISLFAGNFAPRGWALCDGQLLPINQNDALFSLLGTIYGGDGRTTFALPDLRGRTPIHPGTGPGLTNVRLGERIGVEGVTLSVGQLPSHLHEIPEPATLSLLALGGLALMRRKNEAAR